MSTDIKMEALAPKDDLSLENNPSFKVYHDSLESAFRNPKIRNLALSGGMGSGKSSIIRSFNRNRKGKKSFLYLSLIDFSKAIADAEKKEYDQRQLEYSLLNQMLSYCTSDDLPEGSIRGIPEKFESLEFSARYITLFCLSVFVLIFHEKFGALAAMFGLPGYLRSNIHLMLYLFVIVVLGGCIYRILFHCLPFLQVSKLLVKSNVAEAEINLGKERTTLDIHKFELAYILEQIGEKHDHTVVFEDLERLDSAVAVSIMSKLRELNTLTNNHLQIQHGADFQPIRFLYAIDDSTMPVEYRTKFYDCIIPVVPVSHPLNCREQLWKMLDALNFDSKWKDQLCDALSDAFVDYRTLLSLRNEYQVLRALYGEANREGPAHCADDARGSSASGNDHFLFAITAYRILMPEWFERTLSPLGDGILPDFASSDDENYFKQHERSKALEAVRKMFRNGLLGKTSMRLIIGEHALIELWLKIIRSTLDTDKFDRNDELRIRTITGTLKSLLPNIGPDPTQEPYFGFREAMAKRLFTLTSEEDRMQFLLVANSLALVSRKGTPVDWEWLPSDQIGFPFDFYGFWRNYFHWLEELSHDPEYISCPDVSNCLKALCREYPENQEIALKYAEDLVNCSCDQGLLECTKTRDLLNTLKDAFPENQEITLRYAMSLVNLSCIQGLPDITITIDRLRDLRNTFPDNHEIALRYAMGLVNLSSVQRLPDRNKTIELLKVLRENFTENQGIDLRYAKELVNLSCVQELLECTRIVDLLRNIQEAFSKNQEIVLQYAKGLVNLSSVQKLPECTQTTNILKDLWEAFPENQDIAIEYAKGLVNLTYNQQLSDRTKTNDLLKNLRNAFPDNQEIVLEYTKYLVNLAYDQRLLDRTKTINILKNFRDAFPENQYIALIYEEGLALLALP